MVFIIIREIGNLVVLLLVRFGIELMMGEIILMFIIYRVLLIGDYYIKSDCRALRLFFLFI